jgi:membrane-associated phospholipid phosphatase
MGVTLYLGLDQAVGDWAKGWQAGAPAYWLGQGAYWAGLGSVQMAAMGLLALWGWRGRRIERAWSGLLGLGAAIGAGVATQVVKHLVGRPRPRLDLPVWEYFGPTLQSDMHSFPSGHAATSFAVASLLAARYPRAAPLWYAAATAIGLGRVVSGSHHLSDVLAGAVLGLVIGWSLAAWKHPPLGERR